MKSFLAVAAGSILAMVSVAFLPGFIAVAGVAIGATMVAAATVTA